MTASRPSLLARFLPAPAGAALVLVTLTVGCGDPGPAGFISTSASAIGITHVRVIDGTGAPATPDQTVLIDHGRIREVGDAAAVRVPAGIHVIDGTGRTLLPGFVGMHEHLFYQLSPPSSGEVVVPVQAAFARLYLASGVTTIRTAGTVDFDGDLRIKQQIDAGRLPGPAIYLTGAYLNAQPGDPDPDRIAREVSDQADRGATSFKAYTSLRTSELRAAIEAAHARGLTITGHLCAVGFREAAAMGIDNLEHGLAVDTELYDGKQPDVCPDQGAAVDQLAHADSRLDARIDQTIADLVRHGVAVTSTLPVFESFTGHESAFDPRLPEVLAPRLRKPYEAARAGWIDPDSRRSRMWAAMLTREMQFERAFVAAGGRLMAGVDPTGWGGVVAGFGDQREIELLVAAGLTPEGAIRVATRNGADFLKAGDRIGSIAVGRQADLVLVSGDPSVRISDVRNVEMVFKDGVGYDPAALVASTRGTVGRLELRHVFRWPYNLMFVAVLALLARILSRQRRRRHVLLPALAH